LAFAFHASTRGLTVGEAEGACVGRNVGEALGLFAFGRGVEIVVGARDGGGDGTALEGAAVGVLDGLATGFLVGEAATGALDGFAVATRVGGKDGEAVGTATGLVDGATVDGTALGLARG
jgi:hypothetical protein